jgi:hypothetical protein
MKGASRCVETWRGRHPDGRSYGLDHHGEGEEVERGENLMPKK